MDNKDLQFDRSCHVLYSKTCEKLIKAKIALHYPPEKCEEVWTKVQKQYVEYLKDWRTDLGGKKNFHNGKGGTYDCIAIMTYYAVCKDVTAFREIEEMEEELVLPSFKKLKFVNCALLSAVLLSVEKKYTVEEIRLYYRKAMCENKLTKMASKKSKAYTVKGREKLKMQAEKSRTNDNPYSWKFTVEDGETINQYTATFYTCGICRLMTQLGLKEYIPAMCTLDYDMAALNNTEFTREYTIAGGAKFCDCHYNHKG